MANKKDIPEATVLKPLVIVMGRSGWGKSTSIRGLDPKSTVIFNTELKPLPFKGAGKFKNIYLEEQGKLFTYIEQAQAKKDIETIVIDSFSGWSEALMVEAREKKSGYDVFNYYNAVIGKLMNALKKSTKQVILIGHEEMTQLGDGTTVISMKVQGKVWLGLLEKEAVVVLHATMDSDGEGNNSYYFETQSNGLTNAKSPVGMFKEFKIDNDLKIVVDKIKEYEY